MEPPRPERPAPQPTSRPARPPRPAPVRDTVEIPRAWLAPIAAGVLVVLLLVTYLIGRESGRRATEAARVDSPAALSTGGEPPAAPVAVPLPAPLPPVDNSPVAGHPSASWPPEQRRSDTNPQHPAWTDPVASSRVADPQAAAVAAYFAEIEAHEQQAKYWSNPQELAMTLVGQGVQGDTSGFDQLLDTHRTAQRQIESMTVPFPCQEHHRRTVGVLREALALLEKVQRGVASGGLEGLLSLSGEARQLEAETREIDALAAELKRRFGLAGS